MYCGESAASGVPCASNLELRSATAVIARTRDERISKLRVSLNEVTPWEVPTVSVAIGSTVSSADWTPSCAKNEGILLVQPPSSLAASGAVRCWLVAERSQTT